MSKTLLNLTSYPCVEPQLFASFLLGRSSTRFVLVVIIASDHVTGRRRDKPTPNRLRQTLTVRRQYVIDSNVRQQFGQNVSKLDIVEVTSTDSFASD